MDWLNLLLALHEKVAGRDSGSGLGKAPNLEYSFGLLGSVLVRREVRPDPERNNALEPRLLSGTDETLTRVGAREGDRNCQRTPRGRLRRRLGDPYRNRGRQAMGEPAPLPVLASRSQPDWESAVHVVIIQAQGTLGGEAAKILLILNHCFGSTEGKMRMSKARSTTGDRGAAPSDLRCLAVHCG
jgi:hypothetical protein